MVWEKNEGYGVLNCSLPPLSDIIVICVIHGLQLDIIKSRKQLDYIMLRLWECDAASQGAMCPGHLQASFRRHKYVASKPTQTQTMPYLFCAAES